MAAQGAGEGRGTLGGSQLLTHTNAQVHISTHIQREREIHLHPNTGDFNFSRLHHVSPISVDMGTVTAP